MLRKLSAVLVFALAWLAAPHARADAPDDKDGEKATDEAKESDDAGDDDASPYDRDGWYLGIGGGGAIETFRGGSSSNSGIAQARAGYHFLRFAAIETELEFTPEFNGHSGKFKGVDTQTFGAWLNFKGYPTAPWTGRFQPYLMVSPGWWWERRSGREVAGVDHHGAFVSRFGGGIDLYITKNIVVTAESDWLLPTGKLDDLKQVQIVGAVQYRFDE
jgi:hypothetical protein